MKTQFADSFRLSQRSQWSEGQPISDLMARALANPMLISLAAGFVDQNSLPVGPVSEAFQRLFENEADARGALQYGTTHGDPELRDRILARFRQDDGEVYPELSLNQVVLTAGSNQILHLIAETLLDAGDLVLCSSPTYLVYLGILNGVGARSYGVLTDEDGIVPEALEEALENLERQGELGRVKAIYLVTYFDNPSGITTSLERRRAIVEIAKRWSTQQKIHVIEDTAYRELRYRSRDEPSARSFDTDGDTVILTGSFSKSFSPGLRVGWGILPSSLVEPVVNQKGNIDFGSPHLNQRLVAHMWRQGHFEAHTEQLRKAYSIKRDAMVAAARQFLSDVDGVSWIEPDGGLYVWLTLPSDLDAGPGGPLFERAVQQGVLYVPGQFCFPSQGQPIRKNTMRLSFGVQTPDNIRLGMESLSRAIRG